MSIKTLNTDSLQTVANANVFPSDAVPDAAQQMCSGLPAQHGCVQHSVCAQLMPMTHPTGRPQILHTQRHGQGQILRHALNHTLHSHQAWGLSNWGNQIWLRSLTVLALQTYGISVLWDLTFPVHCGHHWLILVQTQCCSLRKYWYRLIFVDLTGKENFTKREKSVCIYSPSCPSKPIGLSFTWRTQYVNKDRDCQRPKRHHEIIIKWIHEQYSIPSPVRSVHIYTIHKWIRPVLWTKSSCLESFLLCSKVEWKSSRFVTTWGWVNDDRKTIQRNYSYHL